MKNELKVLCAEKAIMAIESEGVHDLKDIRRCISHAYNKLTAKIKEQEK